MSEITPKIACTEAIRRSHCDHAKKYDLNHQCHGKVKIIPGAVMLDCDLCGGTVTRTDPLLEAPLNEELLKVVRSLEERFPDE